MSLNSSQRTLYRRYGKRLLDLAAAAALLTLLLPLLLAVAVLVRVGLGAPILFRQRRPGENGAPFTLLKFRTMADRRDPADRPLPDAERLNWLGRFLRSSSLDELPELWNVLRGEMSLVGPRPLLEEYLDRYTPAQSRRHEVRPGITGWAQVNGRNAIGWDEKFRLDVWYVEQHNFLLDLKVLAMTLLPVLKQSDVTAKGHATIEPFLGDPLSLLQVGDCRISRDSLIVIGGGGHASVVISTLHACGRTVTAVFDDRPELWGAEILGVPIVGSTAHLDGVENVPAIVAVGDNRLRRELTQRFRLAWVSAIHPRACVDVSAAIGAGTVVCAGAVVQPLATIGRHVIINTGATVDHHGSIGDWAHIGPGAHLSGNVNVAAGAFLGTACVAIPGVNIGAETIVGAGAVVVGDLPPGVTAIGIPASVRAIEGSGSRAA